MEFQEFHKQKKRMCDSLSHVCSLCKIASLEDGVSCFIIAESHPQETEEIVRKWAEKHPAKTNKDKFKEVFKIEVNCNTFCPFICDPFIRCKECEHNNWWNEEYKEHKEPEGKDSNEKA